MELLLRTSAVEIDRGSLAPLKGFLAAPARQGPAPAVVVIHEIFGLSDWVRGVTDQLAEAGYIAIAPDFLSGCATNGGGTAELGGGDAVRKAISGLKPEQITADLNAVADYGAKLPAANGKVARLAVGFTDGISKLAAHALLEPVLGTPNLRLVCHEGEFEQLLAELALHHLDLVLAGQAAPRNPHLRLGQERLVASPVEWHGPAALVSRARREHFPQCLNELPVLLPTGHSALRTTLDHWFEAEGLRPRIVGEFEDSALLAVFAARGLGVFPLSRLGADDLGLLRGLRLLGHCDGVFEEIHAIRSRRGQHHPLVQQVVAAATARAGG